MQTQNSISAQAQRGIHVEATGNVYRKQPEDETAFISRSSLLYLFATVMSRLELGGRGSIGALQTRKVLPLVRQIADHDQYVDKQETLTQQKEQEKKNAPGYNKPYYYKGEYGNKPCALELMLRIYPVQNLYNLSDMATVTEVIDSRAFSDSCGVDSSNQVPDRDTFDCFDSWLFSFFLG